MSNRGAYLGSGRTVPPGRTALTNPVKCRPFPGSMVALTPCQGAGGYCAWSTLGLAAGAAVYLPFQFEHSFSITQIKYSGNNPTGTIRFGLHPLNADDGLPDLSLVLTMSEAAMGGNVAVRFDAQIEAGVGYAVAVQLSSLATGPSLYSHEPAWAPWGSADVTPVYGSRPNAGVLTKAGTFANGLPTGQFAPGDLKTIDSNLAFNPTLHATVAP